MSQLAGPKRATLDLHSRRGQQVSDLSMQLQTSERVICSPANLQSQVLDIACPTHWSVCNSSSRQLSERALHLRDLSLQSWLRFSQVTESPDVANSDNVAIHSQEESLQYVPAARHNPDLHCKARSQIAPAASAWPCKP